MNQEFNELSAFIDVLFETLPADIVFESLADLAAMDQGDTAESSEETASVRLAA